MLCGEAGARAHLQLVAFWDRHGEAGLDHRALAGGQHERRVLRHGGADVEARRAFGLIGRKVEALKVLQGADGYGNGLCHGNPHGAGHRFGQACLRAAGRAASPDPMTHPPSLTAPGLAGLQGLSHGFFGRTGGVSTGIYASLNAGIGSGDDPSAVSQNREFICRAVGADAIVSCFQVHGSGVVEALAPWGERPEADAMITTQPGLALCILTADCVPVLLADPDAGVIGAAHAGWKGALAGVCEAAIDAMISRGAQPSRIRAAIGPAIQQASYEVGPELRAHFVADDPGSAGFFAPGAGDRLQFDLTGLVAARLGRLGLASIDTLAVDTCANEAWFSNRRRTHAGEPDYGRNAAVISLSAG